MFRVFRRACHVHTKSVADDDPKTKLNVGRLIFSLVSGFATGSVAKHVSDHYMLVKKEPDHNLFEDGFMRGRIPCPQCKRHLGEKDCCLCEPWLRKFGISN